MVIDPVVGAGQISPELRSTIDQINRKIAQLNDYTKVVDVALADAFDYTLVLVNKDGDVLTSEAGEVLISG